jgi:hypothetical protein
MKADAAPQNGDEMAINRPNIRFFNRAFRLQASTPPAIEHLSSASADSCTESTAEPSSLEQAMIPQQAMMNDALSPHTPSPLPADAEATVTGTDIVYLTDLQPQPVEWLWQHRLAAGTLAMLSGEPGSGKTWVALAIAAALTRGRDPFTGEKLKPDTVLYASAEHPAAQVIPPRFAAFVAPKTENQVPGGGLCRIRSISTLRSTRKDAQINYLSTLSIFVKQTTYLATLPNPKI